MNRRTFLKTIGAGALGLAGTRLIPTVNPLLARTLQARVKNWAWVVNHFNPSADEWRRQLALIRESGTSAILPEIYQSHHAFFASRHLPVA